jgi:hypothetical protein
MIMADTIGRDVKHMGQKTVSLRTVVLGTVALAAASGSALYWGNKKAIENEAAFRADMTSILNNTIADSQRARETERERKDDCVADLGKNCDLKPLDQTINYWSQQIQDAREELAKRGLKFDQTQYDKNEASSAKSRSENNQARTAQRHNLTGRNSRLKTLGKGSA